MSRNFLPLFLALLVAFTGACTPPDAVDPGDDAGTTSDAQSSDDADADDADASADADSDASESDADTEASDEDAAASDDADADAEPLRIGAIPDQDPEVLARLYADVAAYLEASLGVPVVYEPVVDYAASVTAFKAGDLDLVWFGGLTGVQARLQVPGAMAVVQRDIDEEFRSIFIADAESDIEPFEDVDGLQALIGRSLTFGSESSTSGRLMPQHFMAQAAVSLDDLDGEPGFSGSHDNTIKVVEAGSYEVGALNLAVWESRMEAGEVDEDKVKPIFITPTYYDYHWVLHPSTLERYGDDFAERVQEAFTALSADSEAEAAILDAFNAEAFIETEDANYEAIERVGREIGLIVED